MSIGVVDRKLLWGRSRNLCAYGGCDQQLTVDLGDPESQVLSTAGAVLGEEAHIRSSQKDGPRYDASFPKEELDTYRNLVLLCPTHHTLVDKDAGSHTTVEDLEEMKQKHEASVLGDESPRATQERATAERVAAAVAVWEDLVGINDWQGITWQLNLPVSCLSNDRCEAISNTAEWLLAKTWPDSMPAIRDAFASHWQVLKVLLDHLHDCYEPRGDELWEIERHYKRLDSWDPPAYAKLLAEHQLQSACTYWLVLEMTKTVNRVIDAIRVELDPLYRFEEGVVLMRDGDGIINSSIARIEFEPDDLDVRRYSLKDIRQTISARASALGVEPDGIRLDDIRVSEVPHETA